MVLHRFQKNALELKLRRCQGVDLQKFLGAVLSRTHGHNFVPTSTDYSRGDLKCDGLLLDPLTIFACYGPVNAGAHIKDSSMKAVVEKVESDFAGALANWPKMKRWVFVTSFLEAPAQISQAIIALRDKHPEIEIMMYGLQKFEAEIGSLTPTAIEELIGREATTSDFYNLAPEEIRDVLSDVLHGLKSVVPVEETIKPVPSGKLDFNGLDSDDRQMILNALKRTHDVGAILANAFGDPQAPSVLATNFNSRYLALDAQGVSPGEILGHLFAFVIGDSTPTPSRQAAVYCILAFLFERCSIFRDEPIEANA